LPSTSPSRFEDGAAAENEFPGSAPRGDGMRLGRGEVERDVGRRARDIALVDAAHDGDRVDASGLQDRPPGRRGRGGTSRAVPEPMPLTSGSWPCPTRQRPPTGSSPARP
jgi:hypothetical protein